ncbi:response regulator [Limibacter armeniacum]|uniref:response regulator n=1 Tax=Limibacter armeniacum TaxID=466084 RepID=UPI002FE6B769
MSNLSENSRNPFVILYADDDPEDRMLAEEAFEECKLLNRLIFVEDGDQLVRYLKHEGEYADEKEFPTPGLILLDLNMPKKDGREALKEIKSDPSLKMIPIVVLTTSSDEDDIHDTYELGVSSFITKPVSFDSLVDTIKTLGKYWIELVKLPK